MNKEVLTSKERTQNHDCAHCGAKLLRVPVSDANWAGLECDNPECVTVENRRLRAALKRIGNPEFEYSSDDDDDTSLSMRIADARAALSCDSSAPNRHTQHCDCHDCQYAKKYPQVPHHALCGCWACTRSAPETKAHRTDSRLAGDIEYCLAKINPATDVHAILTEVMKDLRSPEETPDEPTTCLGIIRDGVCSCGLGAKHAGKTSDGWKCITCGHENPNGSLRCQKPKCTVLRYSPEKASGDGV